MKHAIRIKTVSQLQLLKQLNNYLGKRKVPKEVISKIYRILYTKELRKEGFIILCLNRVSDDYMGIEDVVDLYPYRLFLEENIDEIYTKSHRGKTKKWYISHVRVKGQQTKIEVIYTTKGD